MPLLSHKSDIYLVSTGAELLRTLSVKLMTRFLTVVRCTASYFSINTNFDLDFSVRQDFAQVESGTCLEMKWAAIWGWVMRVNSQHINMLIQPTLGPSEICVFVETNPTPHIPSQQIYHPLNHMGEFSNSNLDNSFMTWHLTLAASCLNISIFWQMSAICGPRDVRSISGIQIWGRPQRKTHLDKDNALYLSSLWTITAFALALALS